MASFESKPIMFALWNRWRAYMPLAALWVRRDSTLRAAAEDHFLGNVVGRAFAKLHSLLERSSAEALRLRARQLHVFNRRCALTLNFWRRVAYTRMGAQLTLFMARRALQPAMVAAARTFPPSTAKSMLRC